MKKTIKDLKDYLLENFVDEAGDLPIRGLDFSDFDGDVVFSQFKVKGNLYQGNHKVVGDLFQGHHEVKGDLFQDFQEVEGGLWQNYQKVKGILLQNYQKVKGHLWQYGQKVKGHLWQSRQEVEGNLYQDELIVKKKTPLITEAEYHFLLGMQLGGVKRVDPAQLKSICLKEHLPSIDKSYLIKDLVNKFKAKENRE